jgi:hypothetical protein
MFGLAAAPEIAIAVASVIGFGLRENTALVANFSLGQ